jgi:hypothetical protein
MPYRALPRDYPQMVKIASRHIGESHWIAIDELNTRRRFGRGASIFWDLVDSGAIEVSPFATPPSEDPENPYRDHTQIRAVHPEKIEPA